ncbi:PREDICTED: uncharacterized protein LOC106808749 [Priapulus caudatus]|uniref:Uncharacterized protein LOC106808749 n=1 Tax=Priapulus caudatus TaxID=37621 RepID=A0ABM1E4F7_PRICU|nr:PREDICTED: uncharacterized protein LOC106808749 [Priapulus caudatus]
MPGHDSSALCCLLPVLVRCYWTRPFSLLQKDLHDLFAGCGAIERVAILDPPLPRHEYTFGFVVFTRVESVLQAVRELHNWRIGSSRIRVEIAHDTMAAVIGAADSNYAARIYTVYVGPMPPQMTAAQLKAMFGKCGPVHSVNIAGTSADKYVFGFVTFHDKGSALKSIQRYNHLTMGGYKLGVSISRERSILAEEDIVELTTEVERCRSTSWEAELGEEALILWELRKSWGVYMGDKKGSAVCSTAAQWQDFVKELLAVAHKPLPLPVVEMPSPTDFLKINKDTMLKLIKEAQLAISETDNSSQDDHRHSPSCWSVVMTMPSTTASVPISGQLPLSRTEPYIAPSDIHVSLSTAAEMQSVTKPLPKLNSPVAVPREERCHTTAKAASTANDIVVPSQNEAEFLGDTLTAVKSLLTSNDTAATPCNEVKSLEIIQTESSAASDAQSADGEQSESAEPGELTNVNKRTCHSAGDSTASSIAEAASTEAAIIGNTTEKVNISLTEDSDNDGEKLPEVSREQCGGPSSMEFSPKANRTVEPPAELFLMKLLSDLEVLHTTHRSMDNSRDLAMGDVLSTQYVEAAHDVGTTQDVQTINNVHITPDSQGTGNVHITADSQGTGDVHITPDIQTTDNVHITSDIQTTDNVHITTSRTVQIARDDQTSPTVQIAGDDQTSPTVQIAEECHTAADSPAKSVPDSPLGRFLSRMEAQTRCEGLALPPSLQHPVRGSHSSHPNVLLRHDAWSDVYGVMPQWDGIFSQHADASRQAIGGGEVSPPVVVDDAADDSDGESVVNIGQRYHEQELEDDDSDDRSGRAYRDFFGESAGGREPSSDEGPAEPDTSKCSSISSSSTISAGLLNDSQEQQMPQLVPLGPEEREDECDFEIDDALSRILAEFPHQAELLRRTPEAVRLRTLLNEIAVLQSYDAGYAADVQGSWDSEREAGLMEAELQLQKEIELHSSRWQHIPGTFKRTPNTVSKGLCPPGEEEDDLLYEKELFTLQGNETAIHELQLETGGEKIAAALEIAEMHLQVMRLRLCDSDL